MGSEPLVDACELAFEVARQGVEADPPVDPPASMRSFLYVAQLPRRAMSVAQRVIDSDPNFRARVASQATEAKVGRAGYLWLHRPADWEASFSALTGHGVATMMATPPPAPPPAPASDRGSPSARSAPPAPPPAPPLVAEPMADTPAVSEWPKSGEPSAVTPAEQAGARPVPNAGEGNIEAELASLRSLVDRLADERQNVGSSIEHLETEIDERRAESTALTHHMDSIGADLRQAQAERDEALAMHRKMEEQNRSLRADLEEALERVEAETSRQKETATATAMAEAELERLRESVVRLEQSSVMLEERLDEAGIERDDTLQQIASIRTERDDFVDRVQVAEQARADLEHELSTLSAKSQDLQIELKSVSDQWAVVQNELEQIKRANASSETHRHALVDDLLAQFGRVEAERDLLASQLDVAHARIRGTRSALESATVNISTELDETDEAFDNTSRSSARLDDAVREVTARLENLEIEMAVDAGDEASSDAISDSVATDGTEPDSDDLDDPAESAGAVESEDERPVDAGQLDPTTSEVSDVNDAEQGNEEFGEHVEPSDGDAAVVEGLKGSFGEVALGGHLNEPASSPIADVFEPVSDGLASPDRSKGVDRTELDDVLASYGLGADEIVDRPISSVRGFDDVGDLGSETDPSFDHPDADIGQPGSAENLGLTDLDVVDGPVSESSDDDQSAAESTSFETSDSADLDASLADPFADFETSNEPLTESEVVGADTGPHRQQVLPIAGDPVAVARHTVSTADVVLLVEGDAVASMGWPTLSTPERREALVSYLGDLAAETGAAPDVVFDGSVGSEDELPNSRAVRVRLTAVGVHATAALSELVDAYPLEWPVAVVTDDAALAGDAGRRGAALLDNGQLLDLFIAP